MKYMEFLKEEVKKRKTVFQELEEISWDKIDEEDFNDDWNKGYYTARLVNQLNRVFQELDNLENRIEEIEEMTE